MKVINNIKAVVAVVTLIVVSACEPIEDRDILKNSFDPDDIELEVIQTADGIGNGLTLKMKTPGVVGYWDYLIDKKYTDEAYVVFPIPGTHTFTYTITSPYMNGGDPSDREIIVKSIDVTVEVLDQELPESYYDLVGENLEGKSWVFDRTSTNWWYMSNNNGDAFSVWWNASECCAPPDQAGKMVFDLDGGANYSYFIDAEGAADATGTFSFNGAFDKFFIGGGINILGAEGTAGVNDCAKSLGSFAEFQIIELTPDRLVLYISDASCTSGWTWIFVPEE